ncbi:MAG: class I SAM-dependent methyltransferase [Alphaproteobacteria bacterium]|nr:class I SAM-dependent methyltransferase [Alphaproteobacteria bacterium]
MGEVGVSGLVQMETDAVRRVYARWAPIYDTTFGKITDTGRNEAVDLVNRRGTGDVLEVGVGTGISLPRYDTALNVTGIDLSPAMLDKARRRIAREALTNIAAIEEMDAGAMTFADASFDAVIAMYVLTVAPDPAAVMAELVRVCRPGGDVIVVNHFSRDKGVLGAVEKAMAPFAEKLGWRSEFPVETLMETGGLTLVRRQKVARSVLFSLLHFRRDGEG